LSLPTRRDGCNDVPLKTAAGSRAGVVEFPVGKESDATGDGRAMELQLDVAVEIDSAPMVGLKSIRT
jgi:hypothetical protein